MADSISFSGVGSGIDFSVIRDAIISSKSRPITLMQNKASEYTTRIDSLKQLNTALATLTTSIEALKNRDLGTGRSVSNGDATIVTATATSAASLAGYDIVVSRLASNLTQASKSFTATTDTVLNGVATTATFELRKGGASTGTTVTIDSNNNTLAGMRDAINAANAGVTAAIVDVNGDGTGQQLVLTSKETGLAGRVELVETTATGTAAAMNFRSINPPDGDQSTLNASFSVNGLTLSRSTNSIEDAIAGVTFTLKKAGSAAVTVTQSTDIENKLRAFVNAYNAIQEVSASQYKKDAQNRPTGILAGDSTLRNVTDQLRGAVGSEAALNGGVLRTLTEIGLTRGEDGKLTLDSAVFNERLRSQPDDVKALLFGKTDTDEGLFTSFHKVASGLSDSVTGSVRTAITGYETSLKTLNTQITKRTEALGRLRNSLIKQFSVADAAIGQLNGQGSALSSVVKSLTKSSDN